MADDEEKLREEIKAEWNNPDFQKGIFYALTELRDDINLLEAKLINEIIRQGKKTEILTDVDIAKLTIKKLGIDITRLGEMNRDELHGLIDRITEEVAKSYNREISSYSIKRALGLWR